MLFERGVRSSLLLPWKVFGLYLCLHLVVAQTSYECPDDWMEYSENCYKFEMAQARKYDDAWSKCNTFGAGLLHVDDMAENTFVTRWIQQNDPNMRDYYTSGVVFPNSPSGPIRFAWQSTGRLVDPTMLSLWMEAPRKGDQGVIVYTIASNTTYGWILGDPYVKRQYICKIHKREAYRIHAKKRGNDFGADPNSIGDLEYGPIFLVQPKSVVVVKIEGRVTESAVLECIVQSNPPPVYAWFKDSTSGTPLTNAVDPRYFLSNGRLEIADPDESIDSAYYMCTAENKYGKILSQRVEVSFGYLREFNNVPDAGTIVSAYDGAKVECSEINYKPAVSYQWMKGDYIQFIRPQFQSYIFISSNGKLYFSEVTTADESTYTCIAALRGVNQYRINTRQPPMRTSLPIPMTVIDQAPKATWGPTIQDEFIQVFPSPPLRGYDVRMECFAYGSQSSPFVYSWTRGDGRPLGERIKLSDHNRVLLIQGAQTEDNGVYRCTVTGGGNRDSKTINLELSAQPYFVSPLRSQFVDISSQLTWICNARGNPSPTYAWYRNGKPLVTDRLQRVVVQNNVLSIADLDGDLHDGMYQCAASNVLGDSVSAAQLKVMSFPPNFIKHPAAPELVSPEGGDVTLPCDPEGAPHPQIEWSHDGRLITSDSDKYKVRADGHLRIYDLGRADEGRYTCTAKNLYASANISTVLKITGGASITVPMSSSDVVVNETVFLRCEASFPKGLDTIYEWAFNNHIIDYRDTHYKQNLPDGRRNSGGLYVVSAQIKHEGMYTCTARTPFNAAMTTGYLTVYGPPRPPSGVTLIKTSVTRNSVRLRWTPGVGKGDVVSFHVIQVANEHSPDDWRDVSTIAIEDSKELNPDPNLGDRHTSLVKGLNPGTSYKFRALALNSYGRGEPSIPSPFIRTLNAAPAVAPLNLRGGGGSVGVLTIKWDPLHRSEYGGVPVKYRVYWRKREATLKSERQWSVAVVDDPLVGTHVAFVSSDNYFLLYDAMVQAFSHLGNGPNTTIVSIYSAEDLPLKTPGDVRLATFNSTAIHVTWEPVADNRQNVRGKLKGYQINYWNIEDDPEEFHRFIRYYGQRSEGMVIGLEENVDMVMDVQIFNSAGLGTRSNKFIMETSGYAPLTYPQEVHVSSAGRNKVSIWWRGVSITVDEEAQEGFAIWIWVATEEFASARMIETDIVFEYTVDDIEEGFVYALRLAAVGGGGYGVKTPTMYFTMEGQILLDSNFASTIDVYLSSCPEIQPSFIVVLVVSLVCRALTATRVHSS